MRVALSFSRSPCRATGYLNSKTRADAKERTTFFSFKVNVEYLLVRHFQIESYGAFRNEKPVCLMGPYRTRLPLRQTLLPPLRWHLDTVDIQTRGHSPCFRLR